MGKRLEGKIAVISGVGSGIGRATAERFVEEGAAVVGCEIASARAEELAARGRPRGVLRSTLYIQ